MNLLQQLLGGVSGNNQAPQSRGYRSYVGVVDGDAAYNTAAEVIAFITGVVHADFLKIWQRTIPAQERVHWGYGSAGLPHNQGYMWFASIDTGTNFDVGVLRVVQANSRETRTMVVAEVPDRALHTATATTMATATPTDRNAMIALPEKVEFPLVGEDSKLILTYRLNVIATTHDDAAFEIPTTVYG